VYAKLQPLKDIIDEDFVVDWSLAEVLVFIGFVNNIKALTEQDDVLTQLLEVGRTPPIELRLPQKNYKSLYRSCCCV